MRQFAKLVTSLAIMASSVVSAAEINYIEDFSLSDDRPAALKQLIPGSEDYYYYSCIHLQNTEQFDQVDQLLQAWIKRYKETPRVIEIQNRQALLTYHRNPAASLERIRSRLGIQFNHQREKIGEKPNLPTALDPALISRQRLIQQAYSRHQNTAGFEQSALQWLIELPLTPDRRRDLLSRLQLPDHENLVELVLADLKHQYSKPFGSMPIHHQLLRNQLDECLRLKSDLRNQTNFVNIYLSKLHPNSDLDWRNEPVAYVAYLERLSAFVDTLAPVHNSLKAHVLYHRLAFDQTLGTYDKARFMAYLQLPRKVSYMEAKYMQLENNRRFAADLNADFAKTTLLPRVGNDESLVRDYLHHFFLKETSTKPYEPYVNDVFLRHNLAEAKIVNGLGEPEQWYSLLPPDKYQALKERIDIDFAATNSTRFAADAPVSLDLDVKNVRSLIVKVFKINERNFYQQQGREVNTNIELDGLVANDIKTYDYSTPPLRRVRRHFDFPSLAKPGVYVIDFIGNGLSSRVVVRKGKLRFLVRDHLAGHVFTILDEQHHKVDDATLWLAGHEYKPLEDGRIVVPYSARAGRVPIVISRDDFSTLDHFQQHTESYQLTAGIYVDRESLLNRRTARVIVRTGLYLNGTPVTLSALEDVQLTITSVDHDGVSSSKEVSDFKLQEDGESEYEFQVPARLTRLQFQLRAKVKNASQNKMIDLASSDSFTVNQIDLTEKTSDLLLTKINGTYFIEMRGKTSESRADRPVQLACKHRDFREPVNVTLQTDLEGRVALGTLAEIASITATGPEKTSHTWNLLRDRHTYQPSLHGVAGQLLTVPYLGQLAKPRRDELSLLEMRGNTFVADRFGSVTIKDGMLRIGDLPRGDYQLVLKKEGQRIQLRLAEGRRQSGYVLGNNRHLESNLRPSLHITSIEPRAENVRIALAGADKFTRVHVFATRYHPAHSAYGKLSRIRVPSPLRVVPPKASSLYASGRNIGDEYRYIIDRQFAKKYPGVMLDRPSVLLAPWAMRSTDAGQQKAAAGADFAPSAPPAPRSEIADEAAPGEKAIAGDFANLDFLSEASAVIVNTRPNKKGVIVVPNELLGAHHWLHVVAVDPHDTVYRSVSLPEKPTDFLDLRLARSLDSKRHFTQQKQISIVNQGGKFVLEDIASSKFEIYGSLDRIYALYATLSTDPKLAEFSFILQWPELTEEQKRQKYSKYACHELNFFLYKKDAVFFEQVVLPFIKNKKDKTFLDHWLVGADLESFLRPWNYTRLNVVEQILLSQRIAADRDHTVRDVNDRFDLLPSNVDRVSLLFKSALKGRALDKTSRLSLLEQEMEGVPASDDGAALGGAARGAISETLELKANRPGRMSSRPLGESEGQEAAKRRAPSFAKPSLQSRSGSRQSLEAKSPESFYGELSLERSARQLYRQLDKTQEWVENNYFKLPIEQQSAELITVNAFWRDFANHRPEDPYFSARFVESARNFPEMMFALALLDLPMEAGEHETEFLAGRMTLTAGSPLIVVHEEIRPTDEAEEQTPILVSQNFFRHNDRYRHVNNQRLDKFVTDEFLVHTVYGCQVVITNPTSSPQKLDVLTQIPAGSLPVLKGHQTRSVHVDLQPYHTQTVEYHFYFPAAGQYPHYPVQVAKNEALLAHADGTTLTAVEALSRVDRESWEYISQNGRDEDVIAFLTKRNLHRTNLAKIAFRMHDKPFFLKVVDLLASRHVYNDTLWSYAIRHDEPRITREFLQHADAFVAQCGGHLDSLLLAIDPVARKTYQHLDYRPLVNARTHQLGRRRQIMNDRLSQQYHSLLKILSYRRELDDEDLLAVTYYLLVQDRIEEAIGFFDRVNSANLDTQLQYDYFAAYLSLYREDIDAAREIVARHADDRVDRWRIAFASIDKQLDEISGAQVEVLDLESRDQTQSKLAATEPGFDFTVEAKEVKLNYQNLEEVSVNYYLMDIELLFSRNPFVQQYSSQFSHIQPNLSHVVKLPKGKASHQYVLPDELHNANVLVEIVGAGTTRSQAYYSNSLALQVIENYGQLRITSAGTGKPLSKAYVKVYAQMNDGSVRFYKDGYTDLRGRFDYSSLNTNDLDFVKKLSLLVMSDTHGAVVREAKPPKR
ncbi:MAG: hypothetical protein QF918_02540 [Pirellulaceae bacterium]|nr:hypothetical protein [Pirellulaceae bacterium]